jgi:galactokinase/mevalonate kinase-like predicted kinase
MSAITPPWDYLILTASNAAQAQAYRKQIDVRRRLQLLGNVREVLVVADPGGRRIGSGGSTVHCLLEVLNHQLRGDPQQAAQRETWLEILRRLRILIIHAGGDARRLPAYSPSGKVFVPLPGSSDSALGATLFDRQLPTYTKLPPLAPQSGQIVITAGDVLLDFSPQEVRFAAQGMTGLGCSAAPEQASKHGVYCAGADGLVRRFLQKPSPSEQRRQGAIDGYGQSILDIGVISMDAAAAMKLLEICEVHPEASGRLAWHGPLAEEIVQHGMDFYREICCAMGTESTPLAYRAAVHAAGSLWDDGLLDRMHAAVQNIPYQVQVLQHCDFLHFGTTEQIISSGQHLARTTHSVPPAQSYLSINNQVCDPLALQAANAWIEGCSIQEQITLPGPNVVVGVDICQPLRLPPRACLDLLPGHDRSGRPVSFVRCYFDDDRLQDASADEATLCGRPLIAWLRAAQAAAEEIWDPQLTVERRTAWNARLFPAEPEHAAYRRWLWMFEPETAVAPLYQSWRLADRYSLEEMAARADHEAFYDRRLKTRGAEIRQSLRQYFRGDSGFSAADLAHALTLNDEPEAWLAELVAEAHWHWKESVTRKPAEAFVFSRVMHTTASALDRWAADAQIPMGRLFPRLEQRLRPADRQWLSELQLDPEAQRTLGSWTARARSLAFEFLRRKIITSGGQSDWPLTNALRSDEIVWGRAPARIDLAGGWSDTPPYSLEFGGCVLNAAVQLNGQPPIQVYARVTPNPVIRLRSIDAGSEQVIRDWDELLGYGPTTGEFALVKAALVNSGFSPSAASRDHGTLEKLLQQFGGGIELTTLAAIPKGSGLGTSSIMGLVLSAVIHRLIGRQLSPNELFHTVLQVEQAITTGGGWQDQIGGSVGGLKLITTQPDLVPQATIRYVPADILDPKTNGGRTLLYYTGITRLAKNILDEVVGRYLDRDRAAMAALDSVGELAAELAEAIARKDLPACGHLVDLAWQLNKRLDANATNEHVEELLRDIRPYVYGAKLVGAGGGGFLFMVCKSPADAAQLRNRLESTPPNARARFFDFNLDSSGLVVTVC